MKYIDIPYVLNEVRRTFIFKDVKGYKKDVVVDAFSTSVNYKRGHKQYSFSIRYDHDFVLFQCFNTTVDFVGDDCLIDVEYDDVYKFIYIFKC